MTRLDPRTRPAVLRHRVRPALRHGLQLAAFVAVGGAAAAVHLGLVKLLVEQAGLTPLRANVLGWLLAFVVSFSGHRGLTFRAQRAPLLRSAGRFFIVSAAGFGVNQAAYALLLHASRLRYDWALAVVLVGVAALTFILGRFWAFKGSAAQAGPPGGRSR